MPNAKAQNTIPPCGCRHCQCHRGPRCRCHHYNALLALVLWDYGRMVRRHRSR